MVKKERKRKQDETNEKKFFLDRWLNWLWRAKAPGRWITTGRWLMERDCIFCVDFPFWLLDLSALGWFKMIAHGLVLTLLPRLVCEGRATQEIGSISDDGYFFQLPALPPLIFFSFDTVTTKRNPLLLRKRVLFTRSLRCVCEGYHFFGSPHYISHLIVSSQGKIWWKYCWPIGEIRTPILRRKKLGPSCLCNFFKVAFNLSIIRQYHQSWIIHSTSINIIDMIERSGHKNHSTVVYDYFYQNISISFINNEFIKWY